MQKIDKKALGRLADLGAAVTGAYEDAAAVLEKAKADVWRILADAETARADAFEIIDEARSDAESYFDDKSEKWQEGDRGSAYNDWKGMLDDLADRLGEPIEEPEFPELEAPDWVGELENAGDIAEPNY